MKKLFPFFLILSLVLCGCEIAAPPPATDSPITGTTAAVFSDSDTLTVHFIDVGQADCA